LLEPAGLGWTSARCHVARRASTSPMTRGAATPQLPRAAPAPSFAGQWMERVSPTQPARGKDPMLQAARGTHHGARLRKAGCRVADQSRNPKPHHGPRNATNPTRGINPFKGSKSRSAGRSMQQSLFQGELTVERRSHRQRLPGSGQIATNRVRCRSSVN
jgi:hypothetical protein